MLLRCYALLHYPGRSNGRTFFPKGELAGGAKNFSKDTHGVQFFTTYAVVHLATSCTQNGLRISKAGTLFFWGVSSTQLTTHIFTSHIHAQIRYIVKPSSLTDPKPACHTFICQLTAEEMEA